MSGRIAVSLIEPETVEDIERHGGQGQCCGCRLVNGGRAWCLCDYHDGFDSGVALLKGMNP